MLKTLGLRAGITIKIIPQIKRMLRKQHNTDAAKKACYNADPNKAKEAVGKQYSTNPEPKKRTARKPYYSANPEPKKRAARKQYSNHPEKKLSVRDKRLSTIS